MKLPSPSRLLLLVAGQVCALTCALPAFAADPCDALYNAGIKAVQTPHHVYSTTTHSAETMHQSDTFKRLTGKAMYTGKTESVEAIFNGKIEYLQLHGEWKRSPMPQQDMVEAAQEKLKTHPDTCTFVGDQMVDGQAVGVYKAHNNESDANQQVRILKSNGLMQGGTLTLPDGSTVETRYEYSNVQAPAGVN
jgi:hypothetical protein